MKLYVFPPSPRAIKVLAVAHHLGLPFETVFVDLTKGDQKTPEFLRLNPNGRMPVLQDDDFVLWESNAIIQYLADKKPAGLIARDIKRRALVAQWLAWDIFDWDSACAILLFEHLVKQILTGAPADPVRVKEGEEKFARAATVLDAQLAGRSFVLGDALSVVDFALAAPLHYAQICKLPLGSFENIQRWYAGVETIDGWKKALPPPM
jgi:glutathione S-transferase